MKRWMRRACVVGAIWALLVLGAARAEDMPIVNDQPLTARERAEMITDPAQQMVEAQRMLIDLNLLDGVADGVFGPKTALALRTFQERYALPITGMLDDKTFLALEEKSEAANAAKRVQQRLIDLSYLRGTADGIFGERSQAALRLFQTMHALEATGEMDSATEAVLYSDQVTALPARLANGDKGDAVVALQEKLIQYGFLNDTADGNYGPATAAAVKRFQNHLLAQGVDEALGITANGIATPATQTLLYDAAYSSFLEDIAPGDEGSEVLRVERRLSRLGYMDLQPDEKLDDYGAQCVAAFKTAAGAGFGSVVDKATVDALFSVDAPVAEHYVMHDIAYKDRGDAVRGVEEALVRGGLMTKLPNGRFDDDLQAALADTYAYLTACGSDSAWLFADAALLTPQAQQALEDGILDATLTAGASDAAQLKRVQRRLHTLYYLEKYEIDGVAGESTRKALSLFQTVNGLKDTGVADADTLGVLFSDSAKCKRLPYIVKISISDQRVYVYELNERDEYEQTHEFICSTGLGNSTPRGIYLDGYPVNVWHYFEKFKCWAKYSYEVEGNIMIHSVIYSKNDESTLRESSLYGLGQKASHGCIRLKVADAKWLFTHCERGSLAIVIY